MWHFSNKVGGYVRHDASESHIKPQSNCSCLTFPFMDLHYPSHPARCIGSVAGHHGGSSCYLKTKTIKQTKISTVNTKSFEYQLHNNTGKMGWNCLNGFGIYMHHDFHHCRQRLFEVGWRAENKREPGKHFMVIRVILEWSRCVCAQDLQLGTRYAFISICKTVFGKKHNNNSKPNHM